MSGRDISVVICAYLNDRWGQTCAAVDSVRKQTVPGTEIILVIDHNAALYKRAVATMPDVTVLENQGSKGLSGARNTGAARAKGEIIAFLDDDAVAHEDWLMYLADSYANPAVVGVGGLTVPRWQSARPAWLPGEFDWVVGCNYVGMPPSGTPVRNLIGANMSFRREAFELIADGFAADIGRTATGRPLGCEETEFCIKLGRLLPSAVFIIDHRAKIWHHVPDSRCSVSYFVSRCYAEGISKARVTATVGRVDGLSAEYSYTRRALPLGVVRSVMELFHGDIAAVGRVAMIMIGLSITTIGYLRAKAKLGWWERITPPDAALQASSHVSQV